MLDASAADYEENVKNTALICRLAHSVGVTVEAELGHIFASNNGLGVEREQETLDSFENPDDVYTDPDLAKDFVERTGVDVLAIAFGTAHGVYQKKPKLDLDRIRLIRESIDIPFVMHGGSGLTNEEYRIAINNGIRKINYYTYMALAGGRAVKEAMDKMQAGENVFFHDIPLIGIEAMKEDVKNAIRIFSGEV
jgi:fructose-bisphosphate aldolase class II